MARVEWSALSGEEVETLLANLHYNHDGRFLRIRPAQGDFGVDLILPAVFDPRLWDVYQIKKFALNLTAGQKGQIEASFKRVLVAFIRHGLPLNDWYVVMPLDPTPQNLEWFTAMPKSAYASLADATDLALTTDELRRIRDWLDTPGRTIGWRGLNACESLVADYPYVVDYYLHGGQQRIRDAVAELGKLLQVDIPLRSNEGIVTADGEQPTAALLTPGEIQEHLKRLDRALDTDPHFRYGHSLDINRPDLLPQPGLVAATQEEIAGGRWLTFKLYARSAQSLLERPIPVTLTFDFEPSPEDLRAIEIWQKYGKPLQVAGSIDVDMPGGLNRGGQTGTVQITPAAGKLSHARVRLRIVDPAAVRVAECLFNMESTSGAGGMWARGTDATETLTAEFLIDTTDRATTANFRIEAFAGREANAVLDVVRFAGSLAAPNLLQLAGAYGPFSDVASLTMSEPLVPAAVVRFVESLAAIQTVTAVTVVIPDVAALSGEERSNIVRAASLVSGRQLVGTWRPFKVAELGAGFDAAGRYEFLVIEPLSVSLGSAQLLLGAQAARLLSARIEQLDDGSAQLTPDENAIAHFRFLPEIHDGSAGRQMVYSRRIDGEQTDDQPPQSE